MIDYGYAPGTPSPLVNNEKGPEGGVNTEEGKKRRSRFGIRRRREERKEERREGEKKKKKNVAAKMAEGLGKSLKEFANKGMFGKGPEIGESRRVVFLSFQTCGLKELTSIRTSLHFFPFCRITVVCSSTC